ncbi:AhpC/TSA family protein [Chitinophaga sedimenti]|uniref:TlpA disulfide reductase family protein n=1 Tax=Chitinophaga sedimenti TaxID=2033606 RepID=UPI0020036BD1|nr:TlpA disulfide reductase family protein [Chitinophaga sedimenti]MCK7554161.1 AhpC/TSA family protein [Chitinophaga sedimenti]
MKNSIVLAIALLAGASALAQKPFTLKGTYHGPAANYFYLHYTGADGKYIKDSSTVLNGRFAFKGSLSGITGATLQGVTKSRGMDDPNSTFIFLEPGNMTIDVTADKFKDQIMTGSVTQKEMDALNKQKAGLKAQWAPFFKSLDSVNKIDNFQFQEMKGGLKPYYAEMEKYDFGYIDKHPGTYLSAYLLRGYTHDMSTERMQKYYSQLSPELQAGIGKAMKDELDRRKIGVPGTVAHAFATTDINGAPLKLADYKGKYVLVDFWASWCLPCRKGNPHLKKLYAEYKDKGFEIIGVSDDDGKPDAWRKAVADDGIGMWKHVLRGMDREKLMAGVFNPADISKQYGIATLPTKVLIDRDGNIIGRYSGGEEDDAKMDEQLKSIFK